MFIFALFAQLLVTLFVLSALRSIGRSSRGARLIVVAGVLARATLGLALFWISYLQLPIFRSLQAGNGFWKLMIDATGYYGWAADAAQAGLGSIPPGSASPFFTRVLTLWMLGVGVSPIAGLLLNIVVLVGVSVLITKLFRPVGEWRQDLPLLVALSAIAFLPGRIIDATQPLKDDVFVGLIVLLCVAARKLLRTMVDDDIRVSSYGPALLTLSAVIYGISGIRAYYSVIAWACLALTLTMLTFVAPRRQLLLRTAISVMTLTLLWVSYWGGAGPYYRPSPEEQSRLRLALESRGAGRLLGVFSEATATVDQARSGFVKSLGATSLATPRARQSSPTGDADEMTASDEPAAVLAHDTTRPRLTRLGIGLAAIVTPITLLKAASVVSFSGGRGFLPLSDADTVVMDLALITMVTLVISRRRLIGRDYLFLVFISTLAVVTALLIAYVVTNFGTMFRLRNMSVLPIWMMAVALSPMNDPLLAPDVHR